MQSLRNVAKHIDSVGKDGNTNLCRAVIRAGFDYAEEDYSIYGSFISYIDREVRTALKSGFKWKF